MSSNEQKSIGLQELISLIKSELLEEQKEEQALFVIGHIKLEISFTVERNLGGGINFQVVQSEAKKTTQEVQKICVALEPLLTPEQIRQNIPLDEQQKASIGLTRGS